MMHIYANALMKTVFKLMKKEEDTLNLIKAYCKSNVNLHYLCRSSPSSFWKQIYQKKMVKAFF